MLSNISLIIYFFLFYLIGSIPVGLIISKLFTNTDLRVLGSKNIGSTNAARVLGLRYGLIIFILDFLKGFWLIIIQNNKDLFCYGGFFIVIGQMFSIFNRFKGGKAIATSVGFITAINYYIGISGIILFIIFIRISGYASLSSILSTVLVNVFLWIGYHLELIKPIDLSQLWIILIITIIIIIKHMNNIKNLIKGCENRFYFGKKK
ncbi:glycerol-3-phosphate 1-O-acyltransferase PlsY [Candidatus Phytoplasma fraxini]|uniref:Glycerol-3-phosphate acyltransferase n=1 Tax=Ash yellows phytoplasma TaxID=35780 RepID=A0ABZ2UC47_ASHYP